MSKYIDAEKLKAELNRRILQEQGFEDGDAECGYKCALKDIKRFIVSIEQEQPEVDLEKELEEAARRYKPNGDFGWGTLENIAYYFYELGLKAGNK